MTNTYFKGTNSHLKIIHYFGLNDWDLKGSVPLSSFLSLISDVGSTFRFLGTEKNSELQERRVEQLSLIEGVGNRRMFG